MAESKDGSMCHVEVSVAVLEQSVTERSSEVHITKVRKSSSKVFSDNSGHFKSALDVSTQASASAIPGVGSASAKQSLKTSMDSAWTRISDVARSAESKDEYFSRNKLTYSADSTQVIARKTITITMRDHTASSTEDVVIATRTQDVAAIDPMIEATETKFLQKAWRDVMHMEKPEGLTVSWSFPIKSDGGGGIDKLKDGQLFYMKTAKGFLKNDGKGWITATSSQGKATKFKWIHDKKNFIIKLASTAYDGYFLAADVDKGLGAYKSWDDRSWWVWDNGYLKCTTDRCKGHKLSYRDSKKYFYCWNDYSPLKVTKVPA